MRCGIPRETSPCISLLPALNCHFPSCFLMPGLTKAMLVPNNLRHRRDIVTEVCSLGLPCRSPHPLRPTGGLGMCQMPLTVAAQAGELFWWPSAACPCCCRASLELREGCVWATILARRELLFNYIFSESGLVGMEPVCGGLPRVLRAMLLIGTPVSTACRDAGHVLEAVADPG